MAVQTKRVYEKPERKDGVRVLVDRLWPRGLRKETAALHAWLRELAPSNELRKWFHAHPKAWRNFRQRYLQELAEPDASAALGELYEIASKPRNLTLLFSSRNQSHNNAVVLRDLLNGMRKPPTGTGPAGARGARPARRVARIR
jgi:uncharacterized protein YeaO (DUF488 family)